MSEGPGIDPTGTPLGRAIGAKAARKLRAQGQAQTVWFGLGMMGLIGWSVAIPFWGSRSASGSTASNLGATLGHWPCWQLGWRWAA